MKKFLAFLAVFVITIGLIVGAHAILYPMWGGSPDYGVWIISVLLGGCFGWIFIFCLGMIARRIYRAIHYSRLGIEDPEVTIYWEAKLEGAHRRLTRERLMDKLEHLSSKELAELEKKLGA